MAQCCLCSKNMGLFERVPLDCLEQMSYQVCAKCNQKLRLVREGDPDAISEIQQLATQIPDMELQQYLVHLVDKTDKTEFHLREVREKQAQLEMEREKEFAKMQQQMKLTTGYSFEGFRITQYLGIISGEYVLGTGFLSEIGASFADLAGTGANGFSDKLKLAKQQAVLQIQRECFSLDGNAIIGIDFDYITFSNNMIGVIANGTAVLIEGCSQ